MAKKKSKSFLWLFILLAVVGTVGYVFIKTNFFKANLKDKAYTYIFIKNGDSYEDVISSIESENIFENNKVFNLLAKEMGLNKNINGGKYRITAGMSMRQVINLIKYHKEEKVKLIYNSQIHNIDEWVSYTSDKTSISQTELENFVMDEKKLDEYFKLDPDNCFAMIVPNTYEVSWAIRLDELIDLLKKNYNEVWNTRRIERARKMGYTVSELTTLASIVQHESFVKSEQAKIAGVYLNRLKKNMPLQADPTLKFANKIYDAQRILNVDKEINSPYNTYINKGLPPGPICLVSTQAIDATLNYVSHNYLFFCAKPQLNGYSDFSETYNQHRTYANAYQKTLNKRGINR